MSKILNKLNIATEPNISLVGRENISLIPRESDSGTSYTINVKLQKYQRSIQILFEVDPNVSERKIAKVLDAVSKLPQAFLDRVSVLSLERGTWGGVAHPGGKIELFSGGLSGRGFTDLLHAYLISDFRSGYREADETLAHELGHQIANILNDSDFAAFADPGPRWLGAMEADRKRISHYANANDHEDFAETCAAYILTDAGRLNPNLRSEFPARFKLLDEIFRVYPQENLNELGTLIRKRLGIERFIDSMLRSPVFWAGTAGGLWLVYKGVILYLHSTDPKPIPSPTR